MLRSTLRRGPLFVAIFPFNMFENLSESEAEKPKLSSPGLDRLKQVFSRSEGRTSKELESVFILTFIGSTAGAFFGGISRMSQSAEDFKNRNAVTLFRNQADARARLQDKVFMEFFKGATSTGAKIGLFCFLFGSLTMGQTVYKGKHGIENYIVAGGITGSIFRIHMGLNGMIAGATVGLLFGALSGACNYLLLYLTGTSVDDVYRTQQSWLDARNAEINKILTSKKNDELWKAESLYKSNEMLKEELQSKKT